MSFDITQGCRTVKATRGARQVAYSEEAAIKQWQQIEARLAELGLHHLITHSESAQKEPSLEPEDYRRFIQSQRELFVAIPGVLILDAPIVFEPGQPYHLFAAQRYANGVNGWAFGPSELTPGVAVWRVDAGSPAFELGSFSQWLGEFGRSLLNSLANVSTDQAAALEVSLVKQAEQLRDVIRQDLPNEKLDEGEPSDVKREGLWQKRSTDGLREEGHYQKGFAEGHWQFWNSDDELLTEGAYEHGVPHGSWKIYPVLGFLGTEYNGIGLTQPSEVVYHHGVPTEIRLAPTGYEVDAVISTSQGTKTSLKEIAGGRPLAVLIWQNPNPPTVETLPENLWAELEAVAQSNGTLVGLTSGNPFEVRQGEQTFHFWSDPPSIILKAYRFLQNPPLSGLLYFDANGRMLRADYRLAKQLHVAAVLSPEASR